MIDLLTDFYNTMLLMYDRNLFGFLFIMGCIIVAILLTLRLIYMFFHPAKQEEETQEEPIVQEETSSTEGPANIDYYEEDDEDFDFSDVELLEDYDLACVDLKISDYEYLATLHPREVIKMLGGYPRRLLGKNDYSYYGQDSYSFGSSHSSSSSSIPNSKNEGWYDNTDYEDPADMYDDDDKF